MMVLPFRFRTITRSPLNSAFAIACRDEFFAQFLSTSRSDWVRSEALRCVAAIHDILAIRAGVPD